jgi:hypothetical protein
MAELGNCQLNILNSRSNSITRVRKVPPVSLKIRFDDNSFHALKRSVPPQSQSRTVLESAVHVTFFEVVINCTEAEARTFLLYADHCPTVVESIEQALREAARSRTG